MGLPPDEERAPLRRVVDGIDVMPLKRELRRIETAWILDTSRQTRIPHHVDTQTIFLRRADRLRPDESLNDCHNSRFTPEARSFPGLLKLLLGFAEGVDGDLGRALLIRLAPGGRVGRHVDQGAYYAVRNRYHLVLDAPLGTDFTCGGQSVHMHEGELWWIDNKSMHSAHNQTPYPRVHLVFDIRGSRIAPADPLPFAAGLLHEVRAAPLRDPWRILAGRIAQPVRGLLLRAEKMASTERVRERLLAFMREHCVARDGELAPETGNPRLTSPSGRPLAWLIDAAPALLDGEAARWAAQLFWSGPAAPIFGHTQVAGPETGAIGLAGAILAEGARRGRPANALIVRKHRPSHGLRRLVDGTPSQSSAILVDDILNSGESLERARAALAARGIACPTAFVLVDFASPRGLAWREAHGVRVTADFSPQDLLVPRGIRRAAGSDQVATIGRPPERP